MSRNVVQFQRRQRPRVRARRLQSAPPRRRYPLVPWALIVVAVGLLAIAVINREDGADPNAASSLEGTPSRVVDGDTFDLAGQRIRLMGIDAPEMETAAGPLARDALVTLLARGPITCRDTGERSYGRTVATCQDAVGEDLGGAMVAAGWATDIPRFSRGRYQSSEWRARNAGYGMFAR